MTTKTDIVVKLTRLESIIPEELVLPVAIDYRGLPFIVVDHERFYLGSYVFPRTIHLVWHPWKHTLDIVEGQMTLETALHACGLLFKQLHSKEVARLI